MLVKVGPGNQQLADLLPEYKEIIARSAKNEQGLMEGIKKQPCGGCEVLL